MAHSIGTGKLRIGCIVGPEKEVANPRTSSTFTTHENSIYRYRVLKLYSKARRDEFSLPELRVSVLGRIVYDYYVLQHLYDGDNLNMIFQTFFKARESVMFRDGAVSRLRYPPEYYLDEHLLQYIKLEGSSPGINALYGGTDLLPCPYFLYYGGNDNTLESRVSTKSSSSSLRYPHVEIDKDFESDINIAINLN
jgi:hypothetical protein